MTLTEQYEFLIEEEYFTEAEMILVTKLNGLNQQTMDDILYIRFGYHNFDQFLDSLEDN